MQNTVRIATKLKEVTIYTDGSALGNPGRGGYAAVLLSGGKGKEISGGFQMTTNNRMEIVAIIEALLALKRPCAVTVHSDSQYVVNAMTKGWIENWRKRGWKKSNKEPVKNIDLWERLIAAADPHEVTYKWLRGHTGQRENERCDVLAKKAAGRTELPVDEGFEE